MIIKAQTGLYGDGFLASPNLCGQQVWDYYTQTYGKMIHVGTDKPCSANAAYRAYIRIALASITGTVVSASFKFYLAGKISPTANVSLYEIIDFGQLDFGDWAYSTRASLGTVITTNTANGWISVDVTSRVQAAKTAGLSHIAFVLVYQDEGGFGGTSRWYAIAAADNGGGLEPHLDVTTLTTGAAPSGLEATVAPGPKVDLSWSDNTSGATQEDGFYIERDLDGGGFSQIAVTDPDATTYSDSAVEYGHVYTYRVRAHNGSGPSAYSNTASATTDPAAPADHTAIGEVSTSADVTGSYTDTWSNDAAYESLREQSTGGRPRTRSSLLEHEWTFDLTGAGAVTFFIKSYKSASSDGDDFTFELSTDGASYAQMLTVSRTDDDGSYQTYAVPASINGTVWVRVTDTDRTAGNSDRDRLYVDHMFFRPDDGTPPPDPTPPSAPSGLSATAASGSRIDVMWTDNASDEDGFEVERSPDGANWSGRAVLGADETTYSDAGLDSETTYYYRVRAYNIAGSSGFAGPASATTPAAGGAVDDVANSENHTYGAQTGTLQDTTAADGSYESIAERSSGGRRSDRYSRLDHDWTFDVSGGAQVTFFVKAYRSAPSDGDEFAFAYSTDGIGFTDVVTVTRTSDDGSYQSASLPSSLSGSVTIRVRDTDRTAGASSIDTIYVDHLFIRSE